MFCSVCQTPMMHILPKGGRLKRICIKCQKEQITVESHFRGTTAAMHANRGMNFFVQQEFDHAEREFRAAAKKARNCPEYYWAELLAKCGVTYCKQEINRGQDVKYVLDIWKKNVFTESKEREALFEKVKKYSADRETECLKYYKREFELIDAKLRQIDNERKSAKAYDIFLCYKDTGDDSEVTPERVLLDQQYKLLSKKYKVFFAPCTLHENYTLVDDFSGSIYHALESAKLLVVVSSSERYVNSSWVCSEWKRYYDWNGKRRSSILTCCLGSMRPEHFPDQLRSIQMKNEPIQYQATGDDKTPYLFDDADVQQFYNTIIEKYKAASKGKIKVLSIVAAGALCLTIAVACEYGPDMLERIRTLFPAGIQQHTDHASESASSALETSAEHFTYEVNSSGGYTITGYKGPENAYVHIPAEIGGTPVSEIGKEAFSNTSITGVHIPGTVKIIGEGAFWKCGEMKSAVLEEGIEQIGYYTFGNCIDLQSLNIPLSASVTEPIFMGCPNLRELKLSDQQTKLKYVDGFFITENNTLLGIVGTPNHISIPSGIETLKKAVFWAQDNISSINIPEGVKEIGQECFRHCSNLEGVTLPASIETIGEDAFTDCPKLKTIYGWNDTARNLANKLGIDFVELKPTPTPAPKTTLSAEMFAKAQKLIKDIEYEVNSEGGITITKYTGEGGGDIVIPDIIDGKYVTEIGIDAFKTSAITGVYIPGSVKIINRGSFWNSDQLLEAVLEEGIENIRIGAFGDCDHLKKLNIPASVKSIGSIIYDCPELTDLTVAKESTWIKVEGDYLITNSKNIIGVKGLLQKIDIPEGIEIFWEYVFRDQDHLTSIEIPEGVKKIQDECFRYCDNLETVTLPASIETIGDNAFADCPKLKTIYGMNDVARKQAEDLGIEYIDLTAPTPTPAPKTSLSAERYAKAQKLIKDIEYEVNSEGGITITKYTGAGGEDIVIPEVIDGKYVTEIGESAFEKSSITGVYIPSTIKVIEMYAFWDSDQLLEAVLEEGIENIRVGAFGHCDHLRKLNIPASVKSIGSIIPYSPELTEMTVAKENTWLRMEGDLLIGDEKRGTSIFGVKGLPETIVIPDGIEILWSAVFWDQDNLTSIEIPEGVKEIQSECFRYSDNLTSVALPFSIETIGKNAFADCPKLKVIGGSNPVAEAYAESLGVDYIDKSSEQAYRFEDDFEYVNIYYPENDAAFEIFDYLNIGWEFKSTQYVVCATIQDSANTIIEDNNGEVIINEQNWNSNVFGFKIPAKAMGKYIKITVYGKSYLGEQTEAAADVIVYVKRPDSPNMTSVSWRNGYFDENMNDIVYYTNAKGVFDVSAYDQRGLNNIQILLDGQTILNESCSGIEHHTSVEHIFTDAGNYHFKVLLDGNSRLESQIAVVDSDYVTNIDLEDGFEYDFEYKKKDDGTLTLTKYTGKDKLQVIVPDEIDGMKVTELGDTVFQSNKEITHVTLSSSIVKIGTNSFEHCQNLKELIILGKLESYGKYALSRTGLQVIRGIAGTRAESLAKSYKVRFIEIR